MHLGLTYTIGLQTSDQMLLSPKELTLHHILFTLLLDCSLSQQFVSISVNLSHHQLICIITT